MKLVEAGSEGVQEQDSEAFKAEVVQHLLTLQVSHPQLREAIQEVSSAAEADPAHAAAEVEVAWMQLI